MLLWLGSQSIRVLGSSVTMVKADRMTLTNDLCVPPLLYGFMAWC